MGLTSTVSRRLATLTLASLCAALVGTLAASPALAAGKGVVEVPASVVTDGLTVEQELLRQAELSASLALALPPAASLKRLNIPVSPEEMAAIDQDALASRQKAGYRALDAMEKHLTGREFFVGSRYSLADISLYAYTHVADEGGFDLTRYPAITQWLARVAAQPGHIKIDA